MNVTTLSPKVKNGLEDRHIRRVVDIPSNNLIAFICEDRRIRVFKNDGGEEPIHVFEEHIGSGNRKVCLYHLFGDILCSMHAGGAVITWLGSSGEVLENINVPESIGMCKLNDTRLGVTMGSGNMLLLEHIEGRYITKMGEVPIHNSGKIRDARVNGSVIVSLGYKGTAEVWNYLRKEQLGTLNIFKSTDILDVSEEYVACACRGNSTLKVYNKSENYTELDPLSFRKNLPTGEDAKLACITDLMLISSDLIVVVCRIGIYFVSLPSMDANACFVFGRDEIAMTITVLRNGSLHAGGKNGYCATFQAPEIYRHDINKFAERIYQNAATSALVGDDSVWGSRKRTRKESEKGGECKPSAQVEEGVKIQRVEMKNKNNE